MKAKCERCGRTEELYQVKNKDGITLGYCDGCWNKVRTGAAVPASTEKIKKERRRRADMRQRLLF